MISGPDLADLISLAEANGAKVILAGDTGQLQAVENGGGMTLLATPSDTSSSPSRSGSAPAGSRPPACGCAPATPPCWPSMTSTAGSSAASRSR